MEEERNILFAVGIIAGGLTTLFTDGIIVPFVVAIIAVGIAHKVLQVLDNKKIAQ